MNTKNEKIPKQDAEFNIYQQDIRAYLMEPSPVNENVHKPAKVLAPAGHEDEMPEENDFPKGRIIVPNWERLGLTPLEMDSINFRGRDWEEVYPLTNERHTRTPALIEEKNFIKRGFESYIRPILGRMDKSPNITIEDRNALHLPERNASPTRR